MKARLSYCISKGAFFVGILLLAVLGLAINVAAQQSSQVTVLKDFCRTIGASNTCNGIPDSFPSSVTFDVEIGTYDPVAGTWVQSGTYTDIIVTIGQNANGSFTTGSDFTAGTWVRVCELVPSGWQSIPRPDNSGGGSTQFGVNNCLYVMLGPGNNQLKFINGPGGPTAGEGVILGRVTDARGVGIRGARLIMVNAVTGESKVAFSSPFGYYAFTNLDVGEIYVVSVSHRRYKFPAAQQTVSLVDSLADVNFVAGGNQSGLLPSSTKGTR